MQSRSRVRLLAGLFIFSGGYDFSAFFVNKIYHIIPQQPFQYLSFLSYGAVHVQLPELIKGKSLNVDAGIRLQFTSPAVISLALWKFLILTLAFNSDAPSL